MRVKRKDRIYQKPSINADSFETSRFNQMYAKSNGLQKVREKGEDVPMFDHLMGDVWSSFYKSVPKVKEDIEPDLQSNASLMEQTLEDESFHNIHKDTQFDELLSGLSTINYSDKVFEWIEEQRQQNQDMDDAMDNAQQQQQQHGEGSEEHQQAMQQMGESMQQALDENGEDLQQKIQQAHQDAKEQKDNVEDMVGTFAGKQNGSLEDIPLKDQFDLAEILRNNKKMKEVAKWAGRLKRIAKTKQKSLTKESLSKSGVTVGNEIDRLLPSEMLNYVIPQAKAEFLKRFAEGQTMQYDSKAKESLGKGTIILCLDQSGSMQNLDAQAKGFVLAVMAIAKQQKRDFAYVSFDNMVHQVKEFPKGKITPKEMTQIATKFSGGGTNFTAPLDQSLRLINKSRFENGDVVFVTDGEDTLSPDFINRFNKEKKAKGFSIMSLLIGDKDRREGVKPFSDDIIHAKDFNDNGVQEAFNI